jgi:hypothetical protein
MSSVNNVLFKNHCKRDISMIFRISPHNIPVVYINPFNNEELFHTPLLFYIVNIITSVCCGRDRMVVRFTCAISAYHWRHKNPTKRVGLTEMDIIIISSKCFCSRRDIALTHSLTHSLTQVFTTEQFCMHTGCNLIPMVTMSEFAQQSFWYFVHSLFDSF